MPKFKLLYTVKAVVPGEVVEADTPEEALEKAQHIPVPVKSVCLECDKLVKLGDVIGITPVAYPSHDVAPRRQQSAAATAASTAVGADFALKVAKVGSSCVVCGEELRVGHTYRTALDGSFCCMTACLAKRNQELELEKQRYGKASLENDQKDIEG